MFSELIIILLIVVILVLLLIVFFLLSLVGEKIRNLEEKINIDEEED